MAYISVHAFTVKQALASIYGSLELPESGQWVPPSLTPGSARYLWTDAFAVVNFISLYKIEDDELYLHLAKDLVRAVHDTLGWTRDGSRRLKGATDEKPLSGGLRIGKKDIDGEDGDGQYHHYLTIWMFALNRLSVASNDPSYNNLAIELGKAIHPYFLYDREAERPRMYWKIAQELGDGPLVDTEGNLDPMDGYVIFKLLSQTAATQNSPLSGSLDAETADYMKIVNTKWQNYSSSDTLDIGMTLWTTHWLMGEETWATELSKTAFTSLNALERAGYFSPNPSGRLAFREFGIALGLRSYDYKTSSAVWSALAERITETWDRDDDLFEETPAELRPITMVMYAAALEPGVFRKDFL